MKRIATNDIVHICHQKLDTINLLLQDALGIGFLHYVHMLNSRRINFHSCRENMKVSIWLALAKRCVCVCSTNVQAQDAVL